MYLRLSQQAPAVSLPVKKLLEFVSAHRPPLSRHQLPTNRLSPVGSPLGPAVVELSRQLILPQDDAQSTELWETAASTLQQAISAALNFGSAEDGSGAMEVLYGRAGLLWAVLNLQQLLSNVETEVKEKPHLKSLGDIVDPQVTRGLVDGLIAVGKRGKVKYEQQHGEDGMPLMWEWHGKYYLGAMHGTGMHSRIYDISAPSVDLQQLEFSLSFFKPRPTSSARTSR